MCVCPEKTQLLVPHRGRPVCFELDLEISAATVAEAWQETDAFLCAELPRMCPGTTTVTLRSSMDFEVLKIQLFSKPGESIAVQKCLNVDTGGLGVTTPIALGVSNLAAAVRGSGRVLRCPVRVCSGGP